MSHAAKMELLLFSALDSSGAFMKQTYPGRQIISIGILFHSGQHRRIDKIAVDRILDQYFPLVISYIVTDQNAFTGENWSLAKVRISGVQSNSSRSALVPVYRRRRSAAA